MLLTKERRPAFRSVEGWARLVLLEAGAIRECEEHGWASVLGDPHAHERAILAARHDPPPGDLVPMRVKMRRAAQQRQAATDCGGWRGGHNKSPARGDYCSIRLRAFSISGSNFARNAVASA